MSWRPGSTTKQPRQPARRAPPAPSSGSGHHGGLPALDPPASAAHPRSWREQAAEWGHNKVIWLRKRVDVEELSTDLPELWRLQVSWWRGHCLPRRFLHPWN